jgi:hypothetical protein
MTILTDSLRKYLKADSLKNYSKATQDSYNNKVRRRIDAAMKDLVLVAQKEERITLKKVSAKKTSLQSGIFDKRQLGDFAVAILKPRGAGFNEYINDVRAYERALILLESINGGLNRILVNEKITDMKLMPNSGVGKNRYANVAALEMMFWAYSNLEREGVKP